MASTNARLITAGEHGHLDWPQLVAVGPGIAERGDGYVLARVGGRLVMRCAQCGGAMYDPGNADVSAACLTCGSCVYTPPRVQLAVRVPPGVPGRPRKGARA